MSAKLAIMVIAIMVNEGSMTAMSFSRRVVLDLIVIWAIRLMAHLYYR